jgi:hypothetical protein
MAWAFIQQQFGVGTSTSAVTVVLPSNTTAGNLLIVVVASSSIASPSISDNRGGVYTLAQTQNFSGTGAISIYYRSVTALNEGSTTVTVNYSSSMSIYMDVLEYSGLDVTPVNTNSGTGSSATPSSGSVSATANDLIIAAMTTAASVGFAPVSPFTNRQSNNITLRVQVINAVATGSLAGIFNIGSSSRWIAVGASFQDSAPVSPPPPPPEQYTQAFDGGPLAQMPDSPWFGTFPISPVTFSYPPAVVPPPPPVGPPPPPGTLPLIDRVPDRDSDPDGRRLRAITQELQIVLNSLILSGQIVRLSRDQFIIIPLGSLSGYTGFTGSP